MAPDGSLLPLVRNQLEVLRLLGQGGELLSFPPSKRTPSLPASLATRSTVPNLPFSSGFDTTPPTRTTAPVCSRCSPSPRKCQGSVYEVSTKCLQLLALAAAAAALAAADSARRGGGAEGGNVAPADAGHLGHPRRRAHRLDPPPPLLLPRFSSRLPTCAPGQRGRRG